ncbi:hypothetical protein [Arcticibacter eurypsychrophilus]|uniref:hypothetical protein n=1 Tax=Arcticibacter eurypsychrophilus TaxID=1434752 RepID=UPI00084DD804|nr:hypothetical protein [Arcticibacter eurypsychrophilus]
MKKVSRFLIPLLLSVLIIAFLLFLFKPSKLSKENSKQLKGVVSVVDIGGKGDIIVSIEGVRGIQFISNGIKRGINVDLLKKILINKQVTLYYSKPSFWTKLSPVTDTRRITELKLGQETVFTEFQ